MNAPGVEPAELANVIKRYGHNRDRQVMLWTDPEQYALLTGTHDRITQRREERRAESARIYNLGCRIVEAVIDLYVASVEAERYQRFVEDFGTEDPELWANHRKTLKDVVVQRDQELNFAVGTVADRQTVVGMTLAEVADIGPRDHWNDTAKVPAELADLRIPEPRTEEEDSDDGE